MATILSLSPDNGRNVTYISTHGNEVTFRVSTEITFATGQKYVQRGATVVNHHNYPTELPELQIEIAEDAQGEETVQITELVEVSMSNIFEPVSIVVVIKEQGNLRAEQVYHEQPQTMERGGISDIDSFTRPLDSGTLPTDIGPPGFKDDSPDENLNDLDAFEDIGPPE